MEVENRSSIESEPPTINLQFAREAALHVMKTKSVEEAMKIFTQGPQPATSVRKQKGKVAAETGEEREDFERKAKLAPNYKKPKDVATAPF